MHQYPSAEAGLHPDRNAADVFRYDIGCFPFDKLLNCIQAFTVISANCLVSGKYYAGTSKAVGTRTCEWGEPIAWGISLLTNFTSTSLIAVVAW